MLIAWLAGRFAAVPPERFDWNVASAAGTAAGTLALAIVTGVLAVLTNEDVQLTRGIESERHRPTLVVRARRIATANFVHDTDLIRGTFQVELENVGMGPAITVSIDATYPAEAVSGGRETIYAIGPGRTEAAAANIAFEARPPEPGFRPTTPNAEAFRLRVTCLDRTLTPVDRPLVEPDYEDP